MALLAVLVAAPAPLAADTAAATSPRTKTATTRPRGADLYKQAVAAAGAGANDEALSLVVRAVQMPGAHKTPARLLYADLLARGGETSRAKQLYVALHAVVDDATKAVITARIAALDEQLGTDASPPAAPAKAQARAKAAGDGQTLYVRAQEAAHAGDHALAQALAQQSVRMAGSHAFDAKQLYAEALFAQGAHLRAKYFFIGLHSRTTDRARRQVLEAHITACNAKLGLPARDGVPSS